MLAKEIQGTKYDIKGLNPDQDYMFRVRARNDFGTSDPTLPMTLYRERGMFHWTAKMTTLKHFLVNKNGFDLFLHFDWVVLTLLSPFPRSCDLLIFFIQKCGKSSVTLLFKANVRKRKYRT